MNKVIRCTILIILAVFATTGGVVFFNFNKTDAAAVLSLSEIYVDGADEWVEIYNSGDAAVDINGYKIKEGTGDADPVRIINQNMIVPAGGLAVIKESDLTGSAFVFNDTGDIILFLDSNGSTLDSVEYGGSTGFNPNASGQSLQRVNGSWAVAASSQGWFNNDTQLQTIDTSLAASGITTNLGELTEPWKTLNLTFTHAEGEITITSTVNLTSSSTVSTLQSLANNLTFQNARISFSPSAGDSLLTATSTIKMHNLTYSATPNILVNGTLAAAGDVQPADTAYAGGTLTFTAKHFTTFEAVNANGPSIIALNPSAGSVLYNHNATVEIDAANNGVNGLTGMLLDISASGFNGDAVYTAFSPVSGTQHNADGLATNYNASSEKWTVTIDSGNGFWPEENYTFAIGISDNAPQTTTTTVSFIIDNTAPVLTGVNNNYYYNATTTPVFSDATDINATLNGDTFISGTDITADGSYILAVTDAAYNSTTTNFIVDMTPPVITIEPYSTGWTSGDLTITATSSDALSGLIYMNALTHTFTANDFFDFVARDAAGNFATTTVTITNIDKINPLISIAVPSENATTTSATYTVAGESDGLGGSPVSTVEVSLDGGESWQEAADTLSWSIEADISVSQGLIMARAIDGAGNAGTTTGSVIAYTIPAVSGFSAGSVTQNSVNLSWNTPESPVLTLSSFDIRYAASEITEDNFSAAATVSGAPAPATSTSQEAAVSGLNSSATYYFGIKIIESGGGASALATTSTLTSAAPRDCTIQDLNHSIQVSGTYPNCVPVICAADYEINDNACTLTSSSNNTSSNNSSSGGGGGGGGGGSSSSGGTSFNNNSSASNSITSNSNNSANNKVNNNGAAAENDAKVLGEKIVNEREQQLAQILTDAGTIFIGDAATAAAKVNKARNFAEEKEGALKYTAPLIKGVPVFSAEHAAAITNFIVYGTASTRILGAGERAGVLNSYKSTFGKLPAAKEEWEDVIKIGNGRWPTQRSPESETASEAAFKKIYRRAPDRTNPHDDAAVTIIAYGLRPSSRNLESEKAAIKSFKAIYGYTPTSATNWDVVRAIAYSGATR